MSVADHQSRNVPIQSAAIVPKDGLVRTSTLSKRISKKKIEQLATQKYRTCGQGIDFSDVMKCGCSKNKAQRILKDCCGQRILFRSPKHTNPQRYYPSALKADILEKLKQKGNVPIDLTEVASSDANSNTNSSTSNTNSSNSNSSTSSNLEDHKAQNLLDALSLLGHSPLYIHKLQLQVSLEPMYYGDIQKKSLKYNKAKPHQERIGKAVVKYLVYPNGKVMVFVACSNNPFKLEDETDLTMLYSFLGQVRDRLLYLVTDPHERIVSHITECVLTGFDINKDITVTDMLQLSAINIQLKDANTVFRIYIKSLGDRAVYRVEESVKMRSSIVDALRTIRNPSE